MVIVYQARKKLDVEKRDINAVVDSDSFVNGDSLSGKEEIRCQAYPESNFCSFIFKVRKVKMMLWILIIYYPISAESIKVLVSFWSEVIVDPKRAFHSISCSWSQWRLRSDYKKFSLCSLIYFDIVCFIIPPQKTWFFGVYWNQPVCSSMCPSVYKILPFCQSAGGVIRSHSVTVMILLNLLLFLSCY